MGLHSIHRSGSSKDSGLPPPDVMLSVDPQEINRLFINSAKLDRYTELALVLTRVEPRASLAKEGDHTSHCTDVPWQQLHEALIVFLLQRGHSALCPHAEQHCPGGAQAGAQAARV